jgi:hypothetical protein
MRCGQSALSRSCPRNCKREVSSTCATGGPIASGKAGEATIREPGDLPSSVSTRQTSVGVYRWMARKTPICKDAQIFLGVFSESFLDVFQSSLAPAEAYARTLPCFIF